MKTFALGVIVGAALTAGAFLFFGDRVRDEVADAAERTGEKVEAVGEKIEQAAEEIR